MKKNVIFFLLSLSIFVFEMRASSAHTPHNQEQKMFELAALITRPEFLTGDLDIEANDFLATIEDPQIRMNLAISINTIRIKGLRKELNDQKEFNKTLATASCQQEERIKQLENKKCCVVQ